MEDFVAGKKQSSNIDLKSPRWKFLKVVVHCVYIIPWQGKLSKVNKADVQGIE